MQKDNVVKEDTMEKPIFEYYVLNYDHNKKQVYRFNVFSNINVYNWTLAAVKKHLRNKKLFTYEDLKEDIRKNIMNQEWSRYEYEISVGDPFPDEKSQFVKLDAYYQCQDNIELITDMVIKRYKHFLKEKDNH